MEKENTNRKQTMLRKRLRPKNTKTEKHRQNNRRKHRDEDEVDKEQHEDLKTHLENQLKD